MTNDNEKRGDLVTLDDLEGAAAFLTKATVEQKRNARAARVRQQHATRGLAALVEVGTLGKLCAAALERGCTVNALATVLLTSAADGFARPSSWEHEHACALVGSLDVLDGERVR